MKLGLVAASLVLVAGGAVGCGDDGDGGGSGDETTSTADFCGALKTFEDDLAETDPTADLPGYLKALKDAADKLDEVGTPDDIPDDAQDGFDLTIKTIEDLPDDATLDDLSKLGDVSDADQKKIDALDDYIDKECPDLDEEEPSASAPTAPSLSAPPSASN
jgi:hypothetical protein